MAISHGLLCCFSCLVNLHHLLGTVFKANEDAFEKVLSNRIFFFFFFSLMESPS